LACAGTLHAVSGIEVKRQHLPRLDGLADAAALALEQHPTALETFGSFAADSTPRLLEEVASTA